MNSRENNIVETRLISKQYIKQEKKKMMKQQPIKDKQKLFKKLFISPSYCQPLDPPLLVSPDFINLLLQQSANATREYKKKLVDDILNVFTQRPANSLLLCAHDQNKLDGQKCILDSVILRILELVSNEEQIQIYLEKIILMVAYYRITLRNLRKLTQWISKMSYIQKFESIKLMFIVRLIQIYYSKKLGLSKSPSHYFYIFGSENTGIQPVQNYTNQFCFKHQLSIVMSFNSQGDPYKPYNLFLLKTEKKQEIGISYSQGCLKITALNDGQFLDQFIVMKGLSDQIWYRLIINLNSNETQCIVDNQIYKGRALLRKQKQRKISACVFGRQFFGMIGNSLICNKNLPLQKFDTTTYPFGLDNINNLIALNKSSLVPNVILSCIPIFTFQVRQVKHCFDIFKRNHSSISDNIIVVDQPITETNLQHLGGCTIILPLFYLARFYDRQAYPYLLEDLLKILLDILKLYQIQDLQKQFQQTHFFQILGQHLSDIPHLQTQKSLNMIFVMYQRFKKQKTKITFFRELIWALNIGIQVPYSNHKSTQKIGSSKELHVSTILENSKKSQISSPTKIYYDAVDENIGLYYKKLLELYKKDSVLTYKSISLAEVIYWAVQYLQNNQYIAFSCCLQHHLNQSILNFQMKLQDIIKLDCSHTRSHYVYLQEILSNYLEMAIKKPEENAIEQIKILLRLFLQKYSACFYLTILRAIKRLIVSSTFTQKQIYKILADPKLEMVSFLVFLSEKTINPDIISEILYLSFFMIKNTSSSKKVEQLTRIIVNLLKINQQIQIKASNPIKLSVQRVRKCSEDKIRQKQKSLRRNKSYNFQIQRRKLGKKELDLKKITKIIERCPKPQKLGNYQIIYNLILNQLSNEVSQNEPTNQGTFYSQGSILILKQYYRLANPIFKQSILLFILSSLQKNPELKSIHILTIFLLQCLKKSIFLSPEETKSLLTIFTCIFSQILTGHTDIVEYYCSIKFLKLSRSAVSLVLPHLMSKVIKLADLSQLCQLMMISFYEMTQSSSQSAIELSRMIICEINKKVLKKTNINKIMKIKSAQNGEQKKLNQQENQFKLFTKILCENNQIDSNISIKDPFKQQNKKQMSQNKEGQEAIYQTIVLQQFEDMNKIQQQSTNRDLKDQIFNGQEDQRDSYNFIKQLRAIEIYVKLFFKLIENIEEDNRKMIKRESMNSLQRSSLARKSNSAEICYVYEFKSKNQMIKQFIEIIILYFNSICEGEIQANKNFIKFILSYVLYKIEKSRIDTQTNISSEQLIMSIIQNACLPFVIQQVSSLQELCRLITQQDTRLPFLQYFCMLPFKFKLSDFVAWKKDKKSLEESFRKSNYCQILVQEAKYKKFFNEIQDVHDLIIVGFYQKRIQKYIEEHQNLMANFASEKSFRNIQKLFDNQNASEQKTRMTYLYENQCKFRKSHYQWDLIWNKMRTYHQPYGFWMAQKFKDSSYSYSPKQIRNFKFQMSQYSSASGFYPVLEAKIIQPWVIVKDNRIKKNKYINSFSQMMKPSHINAQNSQNKDGVLTNLWKGMLGLRKIITSKTHQYQVVLICRSTKATGKMFIQNKQDLIFCYYGVRQEDSHLSFQKFNLAFNRETYQKWNLYTIEKIRVHRYLLRYQALEIIFNDGRSIIFDFINEDKDKFIKELQKIQKQKMQVNNQKLYKLNKVAFLDENFFQYRGMDWKITESWIKRQISNLQYLIKINKAASRGIYDLSQYSVAPWVVQFRKQKQPRFRDLSKTMGALGSEERKKIVAQKYFAKDPFNPCPPFFFGTHYSSPGVVFNLLIRLSPFTQYCKHLQGGKFDIPDRLFSSMISAWRSASEQVSDVRQLIPQMYYLPEIYINIDENYFGYTQNNELISNIQIPPWGANNPYYFTSQLRQIIQSQQVSEKINQWIDLIFGFKQRGKQAQNNFNVYYYLTYEDYIDAEQEQDQVYKKSRQAQIVHFGQIPPQLFEKPHPKRNKAEGDLLYQLKIVKSINLMNTLKQKPIGLKLTNNQLIICKRNEYQIYSTQSDPASLQKKKKFNFEKSISETYFMIKKQRSNVLFLQKPYFIIWGYLSNQFRVFNKNTGQICQSAELSSRVTALHVSQSQDLLLVGSLSGVLQIFQIQYGLNDLFLSRVAIQYFPSSIVHISEFDGFYAITFGNFSAIYKISRCLRYLTSPQSKPSVKFFRSFYNPLPLRASYMMGSPLYTIILIDNANIKSYSINGQFIKNITSSGKYFGRFKDGQLHDVFYTIDQQKVICFSVPDLRSIGILELPKYEQITQSYIINKSMIQQIGYTCK